MHTDPLTVEAIQSRGPALSKSDSEFIQKHMQSGELFPKVTDLRIRADITQRLLSTEELIPSFYTLFKDIRYLKEPATMLKSLLPRSNLSLRERCFRIFQGTEVSEDTIEVQCSGSSYATIPRNNLDSFDLSYQQLWLCSYRICKYPNAYARLQLASLAQRLGFSSTKIEFETRKDPAQVEIEKAVREVLHILQPGEKFNFDVNEAIHAITSFQEYINKSLRAPTNTRISITVAGSGEPLSRRCGYSRMDTRDLDHLFLDRIHAPLQEYNRNGDEISSFYVKRSRHIAFFGAVDLTRKQHDQSPHLSSTHKLPELRLTSEPYQVSGMTGSASTSGEQDSNAGKSSQGHAMNQVAAPRMVQFIENGVAIQVPYRKQDVNDQAQKYADQGKKLFVGREQERYFLYSDCFDIVSKTGTLTVFVRTLVQTYTGKRRQPDSLPEELQPLTKEAFHIETVDEGAEDEEADYDEEL